MKKQFLLFVLMMLPLVASAHDIEVKNAEGVTIYYTQTILMNIRVKWLFPRK